MANFYGGFNIRPFTLWLEVVQTSQSISGNYSNVSWYLRIRKDGNYTTWNNNGSPWSVTINGATSSGSFTYNFGGVAIGSSILIASGTRTIYHNSDGTKTFYSSGAVNDSANLLDTATAAGNMTLTTIPRATTPNWSGNFEPDVAKTINLPRASSGFTHTVQYKFGNVGFTTIATGAGTSTSWTPPLSLLNQIPNSTSGSGTIRVITYNGGSTIGTKDVTFTLTVPSSIVPDFTTVTHVEATTGLAANVGKYVQGITTLDLAITGAAGIYGSTITQYKIDVGGQTVNSQSGVSGPINVSGVSVPVSGTITDSRGRKKVKTVNIEVLPYAFPTVNSVTAVRSLSDGTPDEQGTYLRVDIDASAQSLLNTTERNSMTLKTYTRLRGDTVWTLKETHPVAAIAYNNFRVVGTYSIESAYEVLVEVSDEFSTSSMQLSVPTAAIFMHWDSHEGVGIGKYHTQGQLDVLGQIYQNDGAKVLDAVDAGALAVLDPTYRGEGPAKVTFLSGGGLSSVAYEWMTPYVPWESRVVHMRPFGSTWAIEKQTGHVFYGGRQKLPTGTNWYSYNELNASDGWAEPRATKLHSGIVVLSGMLDYDGGVPSSGANIVTLPVGMRPEHAIIHYVSQSDTAKAVQINPDGTVNVHGSNWTSGGYVSLDGIAFPASGVATWTEIGQGGSSFGVSVEADAGDTTNFGAPAYWKDPYGFVWFRGLVRIISTISADNTRLVNLPADHRSDQEQHFRSTANDGFAGIGCQPANGLNWKTNTTGSIGAWISLSSVLVATTDAINNNPWHTIQFFANGWSQYSVNFPTSAVLRREDGLAVSKGMVDGGTLGSGRAFVVPREVWPKHGRYIIETTAANLRARMDISGFEEYDSSRSKGGVSCVQGSTTWFSLDGLKWMAG